MMTSDSVDMSKSIFLLLIVSGLLVLGGGIVKAQDKTETDPIAVRALTPPMGWNSWDCFGCTVTEDDVKANADYMANYLSWYGWQYIVVDIQWYEPQSQGYDYVTPTRVNMDQWGRPMPVLSKHPSAADGLGFKPLADYVHENGLKFGIHMMRGIPREAVEQNLPIKGTQYGARDIANVNSTCRWNPDMYGVDMSRDGAQEYYNSLFEQYAEWGVDYVKVDDLVQPYHRAEVEAIVKAIDNCGRSMVFSGSPGAAPLDAADHISRHLNLWRLTDDFWDKWDHLRLSFDKLRDWTPHRRPGHWPDPDMLPLGAVREVHHDERSWTNFTRDEQYTMMSLWCIARAPLMFGGHLPKNDDFTLSLLTNMEVIDVNQRSKNNRELFRNGDAIVWIADDEQSNAKYVAVFNVGDSVDALHAYNPSDALWKSDIVSRATPGHSVTVNVPLNGAKELHLVVDVGGDGFNCDWADWIEPKITTSQGVVSLTKLRWRSATVGWGNPGINRNIEGAALRIGNTSYADGIGVHAPSVVIYDLPDDAVSFTAIAGLDYGGIQQNMGANSSTVCFLVFDSISDGSDGLKIPVYFLETGLHGPCKVRDLWKSKDLGVFDELFEPVIPPHGAGLYRIEVE